MPDTSPKSVGKASSYHEDYQWISVNDFRPGIVSKMHHAATAGSAVPSNVNGAAQLNGTYRCIALPTGGLGPLPKLVNTFTIPLPDTDANSKFGYFNIDGFFAFGPVGPPAVSPSGFVDDFFLGVEYVLNAGPRVFTYYRIDPITGVDPFPVDTLASITSTVAENVEQYFGMSFGVTRMNPTTPFLTPGTPVVVTEWCPPGFPQASGNNHVWAFPDPNAPTTSVVVDLASSRPTTTGETNVGDILCHQGRVVLLEYITNQFGARSGDAIPTNEQVSFSDPPNSYNAFGAAQTIGTQQNVYGLEFPNGFGAWGSISAGELFLIKHQGGGVIVSGDLNAPTIVRLPGVISTGGFVTRAASTLSGLFYYSRYTGAFIWRGSDTSEKISESLENGFIDYPNGPDVMFGSQFQFQEWGDWVLATNGYLYDTTHKGWWRIDNPTTYTPHWYARGFFANDLYACPLRATNAAGPGFKGTFIRHYDRNQSTNSYSWQSHPILESAPDRNISIEEIVIEAQGIPGSTLAIGTQNYDGSYTTQTFTLSGSSASQPQRLQLNHACYNYQLIFNIVATGQGSNPAPILHSISFGYREDQQAISNG